jgi:hypothetical protein
MGGWVGVGDNEGRFDNEMRNEPGMDSENAKDSLRTGSR